MALFNHKTAYLHIASYTESRREPQSYTEQKLCGSLCLLCVTPCNNSYLAENEPFELYIHNNRITTPPFFQWEPE